MQLFVIQGQFIRGDHGWQGHLTGGMYYQWKKELNFSVFLTQSYLEAFMFYGGLLSFFDLDDGHHELSLYKELHEDSSTFSKFSIQGQFKVTWAMHMFNFKIVWSITVNVLLH